MSTERRPIKTHLVCGFLGAGKTTFILEQLKSVEGRVAVLVNEFGELGIDGALIRLKGGIDVVEIPGGCICCSQKQGLEESIRRIACKLSPELLLIEPSGVAELSELLKVLAEPSLSGVIRLDAVITVIDAETFLEFSEPEAFGLFFIDQVQNADLILANRADLVTPEQFALVEERVATLSPGALLVRTEFCRLEGAIPHFPHRSRTLSPRAPLGIDCLSVAPTKSFSEEELSRLLAEIEQGRFGRIMRGKGLLNVAGGGWFNLQIVSGRTTTERLAGSVPPRLTLIGFDLKTDELRTFLST